MNQDQRVRVAVNGYGVIGKRVAAAVACQPDLTLVGVSDVVTDWRAYMVLRNGFRQFGATPEHADSMRGAGLEVAGTLDDLLGEVDVVVDCTPKRIAAKNVETYRSRGIKFILQGREARGNWPLVRRRVQLRERTRCSGDPRCLLQHDVRGANAHGAEARRAVSPRPLLRRATDPWESHESGIMNPLVPEPEIPSHQGPDAQTVDPALDVVTMAVKVPVTLAHLHYWSVQMTRQASKDEVLEAFKDSSH